MRDVVSLRKNRFLFAGWAGVLLHRLTGCRTSSPWNIQRHGQRLETHIQCRAIKTTTGIDLNDLSQAHKESTQSNLRLQDDGPTYPTVVQQARDNMQKFENCILLTRVGSFYEVPSILRDELRLADSHKLYFDQAEKYGPLLNLKVSQKKTAAGPVPMAGFPYFQLDRFLKILVQDFEKFVALSEEFANNASGSVKAGGLLFDRRVTRTVTPGTLIDEKFMDPYENNFLLAIHPLGSDVTVKPPSHEGILTESSTTSTSTSHSLEPVGLAWADLSTGDFFTQSTNLGALKSAALRIGAREIITSDTLDVQMQQFLIDSLEHQRRMMTPHPAALQNTSIASWTPMLEAEVATEVQSAFTSEEVAAGSLLLAYIGERLQGLGLRLQPPTRKHDKETMGIDKNSMRALEVLGTSKDGLGGGKGSLFYTVRRTVTKSGTRLLRDRIASPSMSLPVINERLDLVSRLYENRLFRDEIVNLLRQSHDSQRLVQKFSLGRGDADDLLSLLKTIEATNGIASVLEKQTNETPDAPNSEAEGYQRSQHSLDNLFRRLSLDGPNALASFIASSIDEDGLMESHRTEDSADANIISMAHEVVQSEGSAEDQAAFLRASKSKVKQRTTPDQELEDDETWILRRSASPILERLHEALDGLRLEKSSLMARLKNILHAQSLSLRWSPGLGYICHVKGAKDVAASLKMSASERDVKATKSTRSFHHSEWSNLGSKIDQAKQRIRAEEQRVIQDLRGQVVLNLVKLRRNASVLDELDIACSFASFAEENRFVRPILNLTLDHKVFGGRHPTVTLGLQEQGRAFVSNDCMTGEKERIWLITGPNMAGKSTFLRQNALISILAQVGSFVPADHAEIGLVDQIFTRVGSADNLFRDQSTFMVEMMETATILEKATPQSFVIMDEIGRGTTAEDGIAVGFACLHHLYHKNRCRTLFATHFHSLADMTKDFEHLACYCTDVTEDSQGSFAFVHRLRRGVNRSSHALKVARLAGLPEAAIEIARTVLEKFERRPSYSERGSISPKAQVRSVSA